MKLSLAIFIILGCSQSFAAISSYECKFVNEGGQKAAVDFEVTDLGEILVRNLAAKSVIEDNFIISGEIVDKGFQLFANEGRVGGLQYEFHIQSPGGFTANSVSATLQVTESIGRGDRFSQLYYPHGLCTKISR